VGTSRPAVQGLAPAPRFRLLGGPSAIRGRVSQADQVDDDTAGGHAPGEGHPEGLRHLLEIQGHRAPFRAVVEDGR
jgi:hypothetical protein